MRGSWCLHSAFVKNFYEKKKIGFYRDDGLGTLRDSSGPEIEQKRKKINQIFKGCGLNIIFKRNLKTVDLLGVRFNLVNNTY